MIPAGRPKLESHLNFVYQLEGDVGEVDVFSLAPTLLALGELIQESNRVLNPKGKEISVNVKPFRAGSFIVDLNLFSGSHLSQVFDFLRPHTLAELKTLLESIGLTASGIAGAVKAIKFLRGKPKTIEEIKPGEFRLTTFDDRSITVDNSTHTLLQNSTVTNNIYKIYVDPMESQPNVRDVRTYLKDDESTSVTVERDEIPGLKEYVRQETSLPVNPPETSSEKTHHDVFLNPKRGAFGDDPKDWSFFRGEDVITATVRDKEFLARYANGEIRLNQSDLLTVTLLEKQKVRGTIVQKPVYEILKVNRYDQGGASPDSSPVSN